jgi:hypothetical protein
MAGRIHERDLIIPALRASAARPGGTISTTDLITEMTDEFAPDGQDAEIMTGRQDTYFSQKVRNLVSHRAGSTSMFTKGYATYSAGSEAITITGAGRAFLDQVPDE